MWKKINTDPTYWELYDKQGNEVGMQIHAPTKIATSDLTDEEIARYHSRGYKWFVQYNKYDNKGSGFVPKINMYRTKKQAETGISVFKKRFNQ